ncbi:TPA: host cell division inhibitor Icd-like protein [Salmonella enterica subsp. enterica serovar Reading]
MKSNEARQWWNTNRASNHKPLVEVTVMAGLQHTQTPPKYQYRFMALDRADSQAKPCKIIVEATSEHEARKVLAAHYILSLTAVLPIQEVRHA